MGIDLSLRCNCTSTNSLSHPNVISLIMPPPLCLRTVFSKLFGRRCLVEGLVSASWRQQPVVAKKESCFEDIRLFVIKVRIFNDDIGCCTIPFPKYHHIYVTSHISLNTHISQENEHYKTQLF